MTHDRSHGRNDGSHKTQTAERMAGRPQSTWDTEAHSVCLSTASSGGGAVEGSPGIALAVSVSRSGLPTRSPWPSVTVWSAVGLPRQAPGRSCSPSASVLVITIQNKTEPRTVPGRILRTRTNRHADTHLLPDADTGVWLGAMISFHLCSNCAVLHWMQHTTVHSTDVLLPGGECCCLKLDLHPRSDVVGTPKIRGGKRFTHCKKRFCPVHLSAGGGGG